MDGVPYVAIGNEELVGKPTCKKGDMLPCSECGGKHPLQYVKEIMPDGSKRETSTLGFIKCGDKSFLRSVAGKLMFPR
jgi:hypothetical protein